MTPYGTLTQWLKSGFTPWETAKGVHARSHVFSLGSWLVCSALVAPIDHAFQLARIANTRYVTTTRLVASTSARVKERTGVLMGSES